MTKKMIKKLALTVTLIAVLTGCSTLQSVRTEDELNTIMKAIPVGQKQSFKVVGELRPYSGSHPKGNGLTEMAVGKTILLVHHTAKLDAAAQYLNKKVSAVIEISHFPMPDSNPSSQIAGTWITGIKDIKIIDKHID